MKPTARIEIDGKDRTTEWSKIIESITVHDEAGVHADTLELAFDNAKPIVAPPIGAEIRVWLGYEPTPVYRGRYRVDSWSKEGPTKRLTISAKAADMTSAIREPKMRSFHDKTVKEIVEKIAGDHKLTAQVDEEIGKRKVEHIDQQTESDMAFLTRLAGRHGATFKLADGKVIFAKKGSRKLPSGKDKTEIEVSPTGKTSWTANAGERGGFGSASASYRDPTTHRRRSKKVGKGKVVHRDKRLYGSEAEAEAAAEAKLGDLTRGKVSVTVEMPGDPLFFAEALVKLKGFDPDVDGSYLAKTVTHSYSGSGYTTSLSLETEGAEGDSETAPADQS